MSARKVPASALRFASTAVSFGQFAAGDGAGKPATMPVHVVLRTGEPVAHPYWGMCVHDFAGMLSHKEAYALDYQHDPREVIGHFARPDAGKGQLESDGLLLSTREGDRAAEIMQRQAAGTPYEASLSFDPRTALVQDLPEGQSDTVNGRQVEGPMAIFRRWELRGGALCTQGADKYAHAEFADAAEGDGQFSIQTEQRSSTVSKETTPAAATSGNLSATPAGAGADQMNLSKTAAAAPAATADAAGTLAAAAAPDRKAEGKRFIDAFGAQGGLWYAQGLSFEEANTKFIAALREENEQLKKKLGGASCLRRLWVV